MTQATEKTVLVVEDEEDFAAWMATVLQSERIQVRTARDGESALRAIEAQAPDLITLDILMPKKTGLLFYRQMKSNPDFRNIPVIVVTGLTRESRDNDTIIRSFLETDRLPKPDAYLEKPFEREQLLGVVTRALAS